MRIGMENHRARAAFAPADVEGPFQDVPDLREVVVVQRMMRAGLEPQDSGVRLGGTLLARMEQHLSGLARPADGLPFQLVAMAHLHRLVLGGFGVSGHGSPSCPQSCCRIESRTFLNLSM